MTSTKSAPHRLAAAISGRLLNTICSLLILFETGFAQPTAATNQAALADLSPEQLSLVEVTTASKEPREVVKTPAAIFVITQEEIRRSGATTIPEVLRLAPGVEVTRIDSGHWAVGIRGFGSQFSRAVLVLIDGRSVYTPLFAGVYWDVQDTMLDDVERIEVIRGPGGTIWGANAFNGVVNIITRSAATTHGSLVTAGGGNVDQGFAGYRYGGGNGTGLDYRIYGKGFTRGPEFHQDGRQFDDWRSTQSGFRVDWNNGRHDEVTVQGDIYKGESGETTSVGSFSPPSQLLIQGNDEYSGGNVLGRWRRSWLNGSDVQVQAYYDRTSRAAPQYEEKRDTFDLDFIHHFTLRDRQTFVWGAGARWSPADFMQTLPGLDITPHRQTDTIYSGFVQDEIRLLPHRLSLTIGTKLEHNNYTGFEAQPNARLLWTASSRHSFWLSLTRAVRTPSRLDDAIRLTDFLQASPLLYLEIDGNPSFESERMVASEAGYRAVITSSLYFDLSVFHNHYNGLSNYGALSVTVVPSPVPHILGQLPFVNGIDGSGNGAEIQADWQPVPWLQLRPSYSYVNLDLDSKIGNAVLSELDGYEGSTPRSQVDLRSLINLPGNFEFDPAFRYVSALPAQHVSGYASLDVRLGWHPSRELQLSIAGQNLLRPEHAEFGSAQGPPIGLKRAFYGKITWTR